MEKGSYICTLLRKSLQVARKGANLSGTYGGMAEWSIAAVLKTVEGHTSGGSNPSSSAFARQSFNDGGLFYAIISPLVITFSSGLRRTLSAFPKTSAYIVLQCGIMFIFLNLAIKSTMLVVQSI